MSRRTAIFFDLDGTLIDLNPKHADLEQLRKTALGLASSAGVLPKNRNIFGVYQQIVKERGFHSAAAQSFRRELDRYETKWAQTRSVTKCNTRRLNELQHAGYGLAIVTNNGLACLSALFHRKNLRSEWFDFAVTRDDSPLLKPDPMPLQRAYRIAGQRWRNLRQVWFVGDSENDRRAMNDFKRPLSVDFTYVGIGPPPPDGAQSPYHCLDDLLRKLLEAAPEANRE